MTLSNAVRTFFENGGYLTDKVDVDDTVTPVAYVREEDGKIITSYRYYNKKLRMP